MSLLMSRLFARFTVGPISLLCFCQHLQMQSIETQWWWDFCWKEIRHMTLFLNLQHKKWNQSAEADAELSVCIVCACRKNTGQKASAGTTLTTLTTQAASTWSARSPQRCSICWTKSASKSRFTSSLHRRTTLVIWKCVMLIFFERVTENTHRYTHERVASVSHSKINCTSGLITPRVTCLSNTQLTKASRIN